MQPAVTSFPGDHPLCVSRSAKKLMSVHVVVTRRQAAIPPGQQMRPRVTDEGLIPGVMKKSAAAESGPAWRLRRPRKWNKSCSHRIRELRVLGNLTGSRQKLQRRTCPSLRREIAGLLGADRITEDDDDTKTKRTQHTGRGWIRKLSIARGGHPLIVSLVTGKVF